MSYQRTSLELTKKQKIKWKINSSIVRNKTGIMFPKKICDFSGNFPTQYFSTQECQKFKSHHFKINGGISMQNVGFYSFEHH